MDLWTLLDWIARTLFSAFFIMSGFNHLANHKAMTAYAQSKKVPAAGLAVAVTGLMILAGGAMIIARWHPDVGAGLLIAFLVPTAFIMHNFWTVSDPMARINEQAHFWKDSTLAAAALLYVVMLHRAGGGP